MRRRRSMMRRATRNDTIAVAVTLLSGLFVEGRDWEKHSVGGFHPILKFMK